MSSEMQAISDDVDRRAAVLLTALQDFIQAVQREATVLRSISVSSFTYMPNKFFVIFVRCLGLRVAPRNSDPRLKMEDQRFLSITLRE